MKQFLHDDELTNMTVPTVRAGQHQAQLRHVLVSGVTQHAKGEPLILQGVISLMKKNTIITGTGIVGMLAIAILTFSMTGNSVSALQLAQNSSKALANMTTREAEYKKFYPYFVDWMKKAQHAPDLRMLSYDEVVKAYPAEMGAQTSTVNEPLRIIDDPSDGASPDVHTLKYLEFSITYDDSSVHKVVVGVNDNDVPEAAFLHFVSGPTEPKIGG